MTVPMPQDITTQFKTQQDLKNYVKMAIESNEFKFFCIACNNAVYVAKKKDWYK